MSIVEEVSSYFLPLVMFAACLEYMELTNGEEIMYCPAPQLGLSPVLSLRRKSSAQTDSNYLAETALSLRLDANELLKSMLQFV